MADVSRGDLYFVAIGSQSYVAPVDPKGAQWDRVSGPVNSANRMANLLAMIGARYGIELISDDEHLITKADMEQAIVDLKSRIRRDAPIKPVILFYYIGHGLGDGFSEFHYLVPGDLRPDFGPSQTKTWYLMKYTLTNLDVISSFATFKMASVMGYLDRFFPSDLSTEPLNLQDMARARRLQSDLERTDDYNRQHDLYPTGKLAAVPYVALFDDCYDKVIQDITAQYAIGNSTVQDSFANAILQGMRDEMNRELAEIQSGGLVLYAARPGMPVGDFADPLDAKDPLPVGSLARRFMLAVRSLEARNQVTFTELRSAMFDPSAGVYHGGSTKAPANAPQPYSSQPASEKVWEDTLISVMPVAQEAKAAFELRKGTGHFVMQ